MALRLKVNLPRAWFGAWLLALALATFTGKVAAHAQSPATPSSADALPNPIPSLSAPSATPSIPTPERLDAARRLMEVLMPAKAAEALAAAEEARVDVKAREATKALPPAQQAIALAAYHVALEAAQHKRRQVYLAEGATYFASRLTAEQMAMAIDLYTSAAGDRVLHPASAQASAEDRQVFGRYLVDHPAMGAVVRAQLDFMTVQLARKPAQDAAFAADVQSRLCANLAAAHFRSPACAAPTASPTTGVSAQAVGACAWKALPASDHDLFLDRYRAGMQTGMAVLRAEDEQIRASVAKCARRDDIPRSWAAFAVASQAVQDGAAHRLATEANIPRQKVDAAWGKAPNETRQCVRANAAKIFGLLNEPCPNPKSPLWFLQALNIPSGDSLAAGQVLIYVNAKAQGEWAEAAIAKLRAPAPAPN